MANLHRLFTNTDAQLVAKFTQSETTGRNGGNLGSVGVAQLVPVPISNDGNSFLTFTIKFMSPSDHIKQLGYDYGKRYNGPHDRASQDYINQRVGLYKENVIFYLSLSPIPAEVLNPYLPTINITLENAQGQELAPTSQSQFEISDNGRDLMAQLAEYEDGGPKVIFPTRSNTGEFFITDTMHNLKLTVLLDGTATQLDFPI